MEFRSESADHDVGDLVLFEEIEIVAASTSDVGIIDPESD
jgi:hypothetical protein